MASPPLFARFLTDNAVIDPRRQHVDDAVDGHERGERAQLSLIHI